MESEAPSHMLGPRVKLTFQNHPKVTSPANLTPGGNGWILISLSYTRRPQYPFRIPQSADKAVSKEAQALDFAQGANPFLIPNPAAPIIDRKYWMKNHIFTFCWVVCRMIYLLSENQESILLFSPFSKGENCFFWEQGTDLKPDSLRCLISPSASGRLRCSPAPGTWWRLSG